MEKHVAKVRLDVFACVHSLSLFTVAEKSFFPINIFQFLVHPCDKANNGGCSQICNKRMEKHECSCEAGFVLKEDKMTCKKG